MSLLKHLHSIFSLQFRVDVIVFAELVKSFFTGCICRKTDAFQPFFLIFIKGISELPVLLDYNREVIYIFITVFFQEFYQRISRPVDIFRI